MVQRNFFGIFFPIFKSERDSVGLLVPTYPGSEIDERVRCGQGEEGIYGCGGMRSTTARRVCTCRPHHVRSNDMILVVIYILSELQRIQRKER